MTFKFGQKNEPVKQENTEAFPSIRQSPQFIEDCCRNLTERLQELQLLANHGSLTQELLSERTRDIIEKLSDLNGQGLVNLKQAIDNFVEQNPGYQKSLSVSALKCASQYINAQELNTKIQGLPAEEDLDNKLKQLHAEMAGYLKSLKDTVLSETSSKVKTSLNEQPAINLESQKMPVAEPKAAFAFGKQTTEQTMTPAPSLKPDTCCDPEQVLKEFNQRLKIIESGHATKEFKEETFKMLSDAAKELPPTDPARERLENRLAESKVQYETFTKEPITQPKEEPKSVNNEVFRKSELSQTQEGIKADIGIQTRQIEEKMPLAPETSRVADSSLTAQSKPFESPVFSLREQGSDVMEQRQDTFTPKLTIDNPAKILISENKAPSYSYSNAPLAVRRNMSAETTQSSERLSRQIIKTTERIVARAAPEKITARYNQREYFQKVVTPIERTTINKQHQSRSIIMNASERQKVLNSVLAAIKSGSLPQGLSSNAKQVLLNAVNSQIRALNNKVSILQSQLEKLGKLLAKNTDPEGSKKLHSQQAVMKKELLALLKEIRTLRNVRELLKLSKDDLALIKKSLTGTEILMKKDLIRQSIQNEQQIKTLLYARGLINVIKGELNDLLKFSGKNQLIALSLQQREMLIRRIDKLVVLLSERDGSDIASSQRVRRLREILLMLEEGQELSARMLEEILAMLNDESDEISLHLKRRKKLRLSKEKAHKKDVANGFGIKQEEKINTRTQTHEQSRVLDTKIVINAKTGNLVTASTSLPSRSLDIVTSKEADEPSDSDI